MLCKLHKHTFNYVNGIGPIPCDIMFIGEAPGRKEDIQGEPFVGPSGDVLNWALERINIPRDSVFIVNAVRCRPPDNRKPHKAELIACRGYLDYDISIVKPKYIIPLGVTAINLFFPMARASDYVGTTHVMKFPHGDVTIRPFYHPAYPLHYNPAHGGYKIRDYLNGLGPILKQIQKERGVWNANDPDSRDI